MRTVEVLTRRGCGLCDEAVRELEQIRRGVPFDIRLTHLEHRPDLERRYGNDIPVIVVDGEEVCRHRIDRAALIARLQSGDR